MTAGGTAIRARSCGAGEPLILVHGLSGSARWWSPVLGSLSRRFEVHAVDLPGFGGNRRGGRFALTEAAAQLLAWLDAREMARASLVGHSMGGVIVAELAARAPERVERLALADAPLLPIERGRLGLAAAAARAGWRLPPRFLSLLAFDALRAGPFTLHRAGLDLLAADLTPRLSRIAAPALVIWGERDPFFPAAYGRRVAEALPDAEFLLLPQAGHNPMWDQPAAFSRAVIAFLASNGSS
jgi:pimeloyl-ACP methyl ester carboxylesterase